ncbi:MAG: bifunctional riboflavin kinase/FAD synthetase [Ilumatobacteraceae bacterium]
MRILRELPNSHDEVKNANRTVVTIGAYDGVHLGHQAVIRQVRDKASELGCDSVVVTFDKHPAAVVRPESAPKLLTDIEQKLELLEATGVDTTFIVEFTEEQAHEDPADFVRRVLVHGLGARLVVVGEDFHFGYQRKGNVAMLRELGKVYDFEVAPIRLIPRSDGSNEPVSSTAIRRALAEGKVEIATQMLGRHFETRGVVVSGDNRGSQIGFPTANIEVPNEMILPLDGVYAGHCTLADRTHYECAINLGRRPTFVPHATHSILEAHLLDFEGDLYGQKLRVSFEHFLRSERKFENLDALKTQLATDVANARALLTT